MCGITFYCNQNTHHEDELNESVNSLKHRGPDGDGVFTTKIANYYIGLGHTRLSIIDLSTAGRQPMSLNDTLHLTFNGEIYNFNALRTELIALGVKFNSNTDTEVILQAYQYWGESSFSKLRGMFAFALADCVNNQLYIVRDSIGIKPVYLYKTKNNGLYGSSEIKGLLAYKEVNLDIDENDVFEFFNLGFLYEPNTGYKNIFKLMPGHFLKVNLKTMESISKLYSNKLTYTQSHRDQTFDTLCRQSVESQLMSDVPLGIFFSGGIDSAVLASMGNNHSLFFAKYEKDLSSDLDLKYSHAIAQHLKKELIVADLSTDTGSQESFLKTVDFVAKNSEELISDYTFWATYQLSKSAKQHGFTVMQSGMGADELFVGYPRYLLLAKHSLFNRFKYLILIIGKLNFYPKRFNKKFNRLISYLFEKNWILSYTRLIGFFNTAELSQLFTNFEIKNKRYIHRINTILSRSQESNNDKIKCAQQLDSEGFLAHNLMVTDKASMLAHIEVRVPLLSEELANFAKNCDTRDLIKNKMTKLPLRQFLKNIIPKSLLNRPKIGFNPPLDNAINLLDVAFFENELMIASKYLNINNALTTVRDHYSNKENNTYKLWQLLYFCRWLKMREIECKKR